MTEFRNRTWAFTAQATVLGLMAVGGIATGLALAAKPAPTSGEPTGNDSIVSLAIGGLILLAAARVVIVRKLYRKPGLRCYNQGLEFNACTATLIRRGQELDLPVSALSAGLSSEAFRKQVRRITWENVYSASAEGTPLTQLLSIHGRIESPWGGESGGPIDEVHFAMLEDPVRDVVEIIERLKKDKRSRQGLPDWEEAR